MINKKYNIIQYGYMIIQNKEIFNIYLNTKLDKKVIFDSDSSIAREKEKDKSQLVIV